MGWAGLGEGGCLGWFGGGVFGAIWGFGGGGGWGGNAIWGVWAGLGEVWAVGFGRWGLGGGVWAVGFGWGWAGLGGVRWVWAPPNTGLGGVGRGCLGWFGGFGGNLGPRNFELFFFEHWGGPLRARIKDALTLSSAPSSALPSSRVARQGGFQRVLLADVPWTPKTGTRVQKTERGYQKPERGYKNRTTAQKKQNDGTKKKRNDSGCRKRRSAKGVRSRFSRFWEAVGHLLVTFFF